MVYIFWISKNFFVEKSPSPKKHQLSFIISKVIISRSAPPFLPKQGLSSSIPPGKFNFYNEIVTSFCIFFNLSDRFSYLKKEPPSFRESMSTKCLPNVYQTQPQNHWVEGNLKKQAKYLSTKCLPTQLLNGFRGRFPEFLSIFRLFSQVSGESHAPDA